MSKIRSKWTKPERRFQEEHPEAVPHPNLPYSPDFLLDEKVIFLDSLFWHGHVPLERFAKLPEYWQEKLFRNIVRDECADTLYEFLNVLDRMD